MELKAGCIIQNSKNLKGFFIKTGLRTLITMGEWSKIPEFRKEAS